ncbi:hypothetical protein F2P56_005211 [Juglans regia]|uniref:Uncharacterized protein n=1 Tax=Juglans regia TaxID=51240 RepID=A0A834D6W2_JUGRE|nr:hypothetical protein F2P56_005211 [Juglans regia]
MDYVSLCRMSLLACLLLFQKGGGTTARLMLDLWPSLQLDGWEIDGILIDKAREYLGLSYLEKHTVAGGILNVHIGDALSQSVNVSEGYAGKILVRLAFCIS